MRAQMTEPIESAFASAPTQAHGGLRGSSARLVGALIAFNVLAWICALVALRHYPLLLGTSLLAYSLGLRYAVDADHIAAAIDNVTRKLLQEGRRLLFAASSFRSDIRRSSSATALIAATALSVQDRFAAFREIGAVIGTSVSALFLFAIAVMNLVMLRGVWRAFRRARRGKACRDDDADLLVWAAGRSRASHGRSSG